MALWGGRFSRSTADDVFALSRSIHFDWKLAPYDIRSSLAHLYVLESAALISVLLKNWERLVARSELVDHVMIRLLQTCAFLQ